MSKDISAEERAACERSWKDIAARWIFGQDVSTVLLVGILVSLWYFGWYAMTQAIPAHLQSIQAGYERIEANHDASLKQMRVDNAELIKYIVDGIKRP